MTISLHRPGEPPLPISFADDSFDPAGKTFASTLWDFGGRRLRVLMLPEQLYAADGDYTVTLAVTTTDERTDSASPDRAAAYQ
jgi:PKD repeat protein